MRRANHEGEPGPIAVQIAGTDAALMADAARHNIDGGAQIIDINMGCPAKKVCNKWAGSALMQDEPLALAIVEAVVAACAPRNVPVSVKMRSGWSQSNKNAVTLARRFEAAGVQMLTVHGRTREQGYGGVAEYDTIAAVKASVAIPVVANGDITTPQQVAKVLALTGADAVMLGRAAQGRPWIFREVAHFLATGEMLAPPLVAEVKRLLLDHLLDHHAFYGDFLGVRTARKHIGWYVKALPDATEFRQRLHLLDDCSEQWSAVSDYFDELSSRMDRMPVPDAVHQEKNNPLETVT
jgi:tRNA-dihydrouridine synthase B